MVALLDALIKVEGADAYTVYQRELNERITKYNTIANQRAGEKNRKTIQVQNSKQ